MAIEPDRITYFRYEDEEGLEKALSLLGSQVESLETAAKEKLREE